MQKLVIDMELGSEYESYRYIKTFEYESLDKFLEDIELAFLIHKDNIINQKKSCENFDKALSKQRKKYDKIYKLKKELESLKKSKKKEYNQKNKQYLQQKEDIDNKFFTLSNKSRQEDKILRDMYSFVKLKEIEISLEAISFYKNDKGYNREINNLEFYKPDVYTLEDWFKKN